MRTVITGGGGFLGSLLTTALLAAPDTAADPAAERHIVVADRVPAPPGADPRIEWVDIDLSGPAASLADLVGGTDAVVHLASVVSADAEAAPERAWQLNVEASRRLLSACGRVAPGCRFLAASSVATFATGPGAAGDGTKAVPASTYGMTKVVLELLVNEATRRGEVDGRIARLPTVVVRPGRPNLAASSFASGVFREPLAGVDMALPVRRDTAMVLIGHRTAVAGLAALLRVPAARLGADRGVNLPGLEVTVADMVAACVRVAAARSIVTGAVSDAPNPDVEAIVRSWPAHWDASQALRLGLPADASLDAVVGDFLDDFGPGRG